MSIDEEKERGFEEEAEQEEEEDKVGRI